MAHDRALGGNLHAIYFCRIAQWVSFVGSSMRNWLAKYDCTARLADVRQYRLGNLRLTNHPINLYHLFGVVVGADCRGPNRLHSGIPHMGLSVRCAPPGARRY